MTRLINLLTALSLLLCVASMALWMRSYRVRTEARFDSVVGAGPSVLQVVRLFSDGGRVGWNRAESTIRPDSVADIRDAAATQPRTVRFLGVSERTGGYTTEDVQCLGFGVLVVGRTGPERSGQLDVWIPDWFVTGLFAALPSGGLLNRDRRWSRRRRGRCPRCGFDLRHAGPVPRVRRLSRRGGEARRNGTRPFLVPTIADPIEAAPRAGRVVGAASVWYRSMDLEKEGTITTRAHSPYRLALSLVVAVVAFALHAAPAAMVNYSGVLTENSFGPSGPLTS